MPTASARAAWHAEILGQPPTVVVPEAPEGGVIQSSGVRMTAPRAQGLLYGGHTKDN